MRRESERLPSHNSPILPLSQHSSAAPHSQHSGYARSGGTSAPYVDITATLLAPEGVALAGWESSLDEGVRVSQEIPGVLRLLVRAHGLFLTTTVLNVDYNTNKLRVVRVSAVGGDHNSNTWCGRVMWVCCAHPPIHPSIWHQMLLQQMLLPIASQTQLQPWLLGECSPPHLAIVLLRSCMRAELVRGRV